ncbi:UDP-N-acetylmuramoyl-L-alanyl-D-glutamate--2,6-diaminopimelate ligase [BD1-7 clade bacterium]|uniref:UDP-N-acetylmuramoyl-L-alanyl-D-glutamate--2,6-diaminopimelate ligase n=1 Tax=BD1-7 clade bacterium TaxID=2029982 RepID=A0A5S9QBM4_9GAMM|nr:UDP-N-acetylmuramoyl-L-alanyl-D-glutamate--2,6-diaminopimelate ligase [BD1-7 clade bacterium]CAA0115294.1 UDP-N-acetylmuramoyl-L-alanyl-D-glutamate--2,6-diaminopimelate ligase [BD1-7 clade bacterium]
MKTMPLSQLIALSNLTIDPEVRGLELDSRKVGAGDLFVALKGAQSDGHDYIPQAINAGAVAVVAERPLESLEPVRLPKGVPYIVLADLRQRLGTIAQRFYWSDIDVMPVVGVTGTNGKTSVSNYVAQLLRLLGQKTGEIGTLGVNVGDGWEATGNTTPDVLATHQYLRSMKDAGCRYAVMEISSHALDQGRVDGVNVVAGVYTNLSHDHLDYHKTIDAYREAKARMFSMPSLQVALINDDDESGHSMAKSCPPDVDIVRYSLVNRGADVRVSDLNFVGSRYRGCIHVGELDLPFSARLSGRFNISNMLAAVMTVYRLGFDLDETVALVEQLEPVRGRMESVNNDSGAHVVVDYAHTPDALEKALGALRTETLGRLLLVFGCGGDRDSTKRPAMGRIAEAWADFTWITSDNPRGEDPQAICADIATGFEYDDFSIVVDRKQAIIQAIGELEQGDTLLIAGKGHETYQVCGDTTVAFDDVSEARQALEPAGGVSC